MKISISSLRNLQILKSIEDFSESERLSIIDGINELRIIIEDNYKEILNKEIAIEFNIGSRLGEPREYLVVYANPEYKNNPYVFILKQKENQRELVSCTTLDSFKALADLDERKSINNVLTVGFENLPKHAFLSINQIEIARNFAEKYDER